MANDQASYIASLDLTLATAIDASTWTDAILIDALRQALAAYDRTVVYETSFTVTTAGYTQDLSGMTALLEIKDIAWPWSSGLSYNQIRRKYRYYDAHKIDMTPAYPAVNDVIRVRHTKIHYIKDLDSAASTTVPTRHAHLINLAAAAWACTLRIRQMSENPALPKSSIHDMERMAATYRDQFIEALADINPTPTPAWSYYGLD